MNRIAAVAIAFGAAFAVCGALFAVFIARPPQAPAVALADAAGHRFTLTGERGKAVALTFGYTHCPDVCPMTLTALARAKRMLGSDGRNVAVVFVSVDPERDTPAATARYARLFDPAFIGLSGSERDLTPIYEAYHVYRQRIPGTTATGYEMAHSSQIDIIGPHGRLRDKEPWDATAGSLAHALHAAEGHA